MRFALHDKLGNFVANVETGGNFTPDIIVWGQRYFYRRVKFRFGLMQEEYEFTEAVVDTAYEAGSQEPPKQ